MTCKSCGLDHRGWISCAKARRDTQQTDPAPPEAPAVSTKPPKLVSTNPRRGDRHKPGYQAALTRKRRAAAK